MKKDILSAKVTPLRVYFAGLPLSFKGENDQEAKGIEQREKLLPGIFKEGGLGKKIFVGNDKCFIYGGPHVWLQYKDEHELIFYKRRYPDEIPIKCYEQIDESDAIFCVLNNAALLTHRTHMEIGYALALGKPVFIQSDINSLSLGDRPWFLFYSPNVFWETEGKLCLPDSLLRVDDLKTMPYNEYLETEHWKILREKVKSRDDYECKMCKSKQNLEVHHNTYERRGGELLGDLITLCHDCHQHFKGRKVGRG